MLNLSGHWIITRLEGIAGRIQSALRKYDKVRVTTEGLEVLDSAGASGPNDPLAEQVMYPTAQRLLQHCDAVLRLPGASNGADQDVAIARRRGIPVYTSLDQIPRAERTRS